MQPKPDRKNDAPPERNSKTSRRRSIANIDSNATGAAAAAQSASDVDDVSAGAPAEQGGEA